MKQRIDKICIDSTNNKLKIGYYERGRDALGSVLDNIGVKHRDKILLPSYIGWSAREGSGVYDPIRDRQIDPVFYRLNQHLEIDTEDIITKIQTAGAKVIIFIHYFGFTDSQCKHIIKAAKDHNIFVIEDAAHAIFTDFIGDKCGRDGDFTIYSLHKMLPMQRGGMLLANRDNALPNEATISCKYGNPFHYDFRAISKIRIKNYNNISKCINTNNEMIIPLHRKLPYGIIPHTYPIILPFSNRNNVYQEMNDMGWGVVSLYHTMIDAIEQNEFSSTCGLSKLILNLPVHQGLDPLLIRDMINDLVKVVKKHIQ